MANYTSTPINIGTGPGGTDGDDTRSAFAKAIADFAQIFAAFTFDSTDNHVTIPNQPAFRVRATTQSNVTGNGTTHTITFTNEDFDQDSDFASPTFTVPTTGVYFVSTTIGTLGLTSANQTGWNLIILPSVGASLRQVWDRYVTSGSNEESKTMSGLMFLTAGTTVTVTLQVTGEASDVVDLDTITEFSAVLVA